MPGLFIEPIVYVLIAYWLAGLQANINAFFFTVIAAVLTMNVSCACGLYKCVALTSPFLWIKFLMFQGYFSPVHLTHLL